MSFSKDLGCIAVGFSDGKVSIIMWPIAPNKKTFKYDVFLQITAITDILFTYNSKYLIAGSDDGNIYVLESN